MRIAILGAGLSGLSCAHELERLGFAPVLFERRDKVGDRFPNVEVMAQFFHHNPQQDIFHYLREELHLPVNPEHGLTRMVMHSYRHQAVVTGNLGYSTIRGDDERSLERQLARHVQAPIHFGQAPAVPELAREYDRVVVANGDQVWSREFMQFEPHIEWWVRGAVVEGEFNPSELHFFFNTAYCKTGYALIAPFDARTAAVGVGVPHSSRAEAEAYWQVFRQAEGGRWGTERQQFRQEGYAAGVVRRHVLGTVLLVGNAGGFLEGLGIAGQCPAMGSGVAAAREIVMGDRSLQRFARRWRAYYSRFWRVRRNVNSWTDLEMDRLVQAAATGAGSLLSHSPWPLLAPAATGLNLLRRSDDHSPEVGLH